MEELKNLWKPFENSNKSLQYVFLLLELIGIILLFQLSHIQGIPTIFQIGEEFKNLIVSGGFWNELFTTTCLIAYGMALVTLFSLILSYLSVLGGFTKLINILCSFRYLTAIGISYLFILIFKDNLSIKISLLLFVMVPFFLTSMLSEINKSLKQDVELCFTLKKNRWWILWEVMVVGKLHVIFDVIKSNFAISLATITLVEGIAVGEGGVGAMLVIANRAFNIPKILAILLAVLLYGIVMDWLINGIKNYFFKYTKLI